MTAHPRLTRPARLVAVLAALILLALYISALFETDGDATLIAQIEQAEDPTGTLGLTDMMQARFEPATHIHKTEFHFSVHWFRIALAPRGDRSDIILHVWPSVLDDVTLFIPDQAPDGWRAVRNGDQVDYMQRDLRSPAIGFAIPATLQGRPLYLRVENKTASNMIFTAALPRTSETNIYRLMALHIVFFGLMGAGLMLSVLRLVEKPTALSASMFGFMATYLVYAASALGYGAVLYGGYWTGLHDTITNISSVVVVLLSMLFQRFYLSSQGPNRRVLRAADLVIAGQVLVFVPQFLGDYRLAWLGTTVLSLAFLVMLVPLVATARIRSRGFRLTLHLAYAVYLAVSGLRVLAQAGVVSTTASTRHFVEIFGLNSLFLAIVLITLDRRQRSERDREILFSLATTRASQTADTRNAETQQNFIRMLVHEVRNKLTVLQLSLPAVTDDAQRKRIAEAIGGLNSAVAKAQQAIWLARGTWPARPERVAVLDALDRVIDQLAATDRIVPQGDVDAPEVTADKGMLDALLAEALQALLGQNEPDGAVAIDISQPSPASPCVLDMRVVLTADAPAPDLDHANRISAAMGASLRLSRPALDRLHLSLSLPA